MNDVCKLLLVEDSDDEVAFFRQAAEKTSGFAIVGRVSNGAEAMHYLDRKGKYADRERYSWPDVVVLEIRMPNGNGLEFLEWMHRRKGMPEAVIFSRSEAEEEKKRALALGATLYQHKTSEVEVIERFLHWVKKLWKLASSEKVVVKNVAVISFSASHLVVGEKAAWLMKTAA